MISQIWKLLKTTPFSRNLLALAYYRFNHNQRTIRGVENIIQINLEGSLPRLKNVSFKLFGNQNSVIIGAGVHLSNTVIQIEGSNNQLVIGENCRISGGCLWLKDENCKLQIGKNTTIQQAIIGAAEPRSSIVIGADCMIAHDVDIRCSDSHSIIDLHTNQRINHAQDISIADHVWIAKSTQILKGVHIGKDSIIASGAIVTRDVAANCIAAGVPAKVKRTDVTWDRSLID